MSGSFSPREAWGDFDPARGRLCAVPPSRARDSVCLTLRPAPDHLLGTGGGVGGGEEGAGVAGGDPALLQVVADGFGEVEEPQGVGDMAAALADDAAPDPPGSDGTRG